MEQLQRQVAEMAIRLLSIPANSLRDDPEALADIEKLATRVIKEVAALRARKDYLPGEQRGAWRKFSAR